MSLSHAALLGLVQGIGEFLPISSSGHLVLISWFMKADYQGLAFDVALHVGTLVAILVFFWRDWVRLAIDGLTKGLKTREGKLFWYIVAASIPAAIFGLSAKDQIETVFRSPFVISFMLIAMGVLLHWADLRGRKNKEIDATSFADAMLIGAMQAIALVPGTSRSGITMTGGLFTGMTREAAARFSFLLSTPAVVGAAVLELPTLVESGIDAPVIVGTVVSALSGLLAIGFLLRFLRTNGFQLFVAYRIILGLAVAAIAVFR